MRDCLGNLRVIVREGRAAARDRPAGEPLLRRELETDDLLREAVHGRAAEDPALCVEQVAVDRLRAQELGHLVDEPLQHGVQLELARHDLRRFEQRALLAQATLVLGEELGGVDREADLVRDRLDE